MERQNGSNNSDLENLVIVALKSNPNGANQKILQESTSSSPAELAPLLNKLIGQQKIDLLKRGKQLVYVWKGDGKKAQTADVEEKLVLDAVTRAGNNGVSAKDLKFALNLPQPFITKILKSMEAKKIVKSVSTSSRQKIFMLYDLAPSHAVTGGIFYSGQEFESEFVDVLGEQCYRYLLQAKALAEKLSDAISQGRASFKSSKDICDYINGLKISKVDLRLLDIEKILDALVYDNKIEKSIALTKAKCTESVSENFYRVIKPLTLNPGLVRMPCGVCPVYKQCGKDYNVSPSTCIYLKEWLEF